MMTDSCVESRFCEYMLDRRLYIQRGINLEKACRMMNLTPEEMNEYLDENHDGPFGEVVHIYRVEEAKDIWARAADTSLSQVARQVGYASRFAFLWHFVRVVHCLPWVWKRRYGIVL